MKAVLISIHPKWCELIASGEKLVEVRKTKPKLEIPFKCYIYCTSSNVHECLMQNEGGVKLIYACNYKTAIPCGGHIANGKVIGEFVCDKVDEYRYGVYDGEFSYHIPTVEGEKTCLEYTEAEEYGNGKPLYFWHISDLVIYDKPKELSEFRSYNVKVDVDDNGYPMPTHEIKRPPQSYMYVEELR